MWNAFQKWILILAVLAFVSGNFLGGLNGRYRLAILKDVFSTQHPMARFDSWTGEVEVKHLGKWESGASSWVEKLE